MMRRHGLALACAAALVGGCAAPSPPSAAPGSPAGPTVGAAGEARYRCEFGMDFSVRFVDDSAVLDAGPRGRDILLRDAGGTSASQSVWSNARMRAEFGLGASGREAVLHYPLLPLSARCVAD